MKIRSHFDALISNIIIIIVIIIIMIMTKGFVFYFNPVHMF